MVDSQNNIQHIHKETILHEEKRKSKEIKVKNSNFSSKRGKKHRKKKESKKLRREREKARKHLLTPGNFEFHEE